MEDITQIKFRLKKLIIDACRLDDVVPEQIDSTAPLIGGTGVLELDSLDALEIAVSIQRAFGVKIDDAMVAASAMRTIDTLAEFIIEEREGSES